jgi:arylsulfatase A-like enzyme
MSEIPNNDFSENILGNLGEKYIRDMAKKESPFMLFMSHEAPHSPWTVPKEYADFLNNIDISLLEIPDHAWESKHPELKSYLEKRSAAAPDDERLKYAIRIYNTLIKIVDDNVGKLLKALDETGQRDNTVIIVSSDHGDYLGNYRAMGKCISPADNLLRVPLIFNAPKQFAPHVNRSLVQNVDIFPTLAAIAGLDIPSSVHGMSLIPALNGGEIDRQYAFSEEHNDFFDSWMIAQDERWKLVYYASGREELYDLKVDPHEWCNLSGQKKCQQHIDRLKSELLKWRFRCIDCKKSQSGSFVRDFMKQGFFRY